MVGDAGVAERKRVLRATLRAVRRTLSPAQAADEAVRTVALVEALIAARGACEVGSYCALADELSLDGLHHRRWRSGGAVWLPRVAGVQLAWHRVTDPDVLIPGAFAVREPDPDRCPSLPLPVDCLLLVPGVGFAPDGRRLGQGGGFYDRLLAHHRGLAVGVGFACQRCDELPVAAHDRRMSALILGGTTVLEPG
ncbi:MAG: 5-formyltetrahydrofolate cyclo-ligase [Planctomycetes bacterium]|nr:5-formyltetrahydrofolate cyclo-ligase [Planctomycetota bacterium]